MEIKGLISAVFLITLFAACNSAIDTSDKNEADSTIAAVPADIRDDQTQQVYDDYLVLKDNLVASDVTMVQNAGKDLAESLAKIDGCENTAALASKIAGSDNLKAQRSDFTALSSDIIALMKHTELNSGQLFVQYCPMANDGDGAYWLAAEKGIRNPYYGDEMMECGSVEEVISKK